MNIQARGKIIIALTLFTTVIAIYLGFFAVEAPQMERLYRGYTFYFLALAGLLWLQRTVEILLCARDDFKKWFKNNYAALLLALAIVAAIAVAIPAEYRILADETNLLGTATAMFDHHKCYNPTQVLYYFHGMDRTIESVVDMRPAFYPFQVYLAHTLLGYDPANGFVVNLLAGLLIFVLLYALVEPHFGKGAGALAMLMLAAFPLLVMYMRSCGFETVNLLWIMILVASCRFFLQRRDAAAAEMVFLVLPLLAQTRYESVLAVFCAAPVILFCLPGKEYACLGWRTVLLPMLFLPVAWLRIITFSSKAFQVSSVDQAFGFDLLLNNLRQALLFFAGAERQYGMVSLIGLLALAGLFKLCFDLVAGRRFFGADSLAKEDAKPQPCGQLRDGAGFAPMLFLIATLTLVHALARFSYYWGNLTLQYTSRLGVVFLPLLAFLAVYFLHSLLQLRFLRLHWLFLGALALIVHGWPVAAKNLAVRDIFYYREFKSVQGFLERNYPDKSDYFIISDLANLYTPFRYSALYTGYAAAKPYEIKAQLERRTYRFALVIQKINISNGKPVAASELGRQFPLKKLYETQLNASEFIRISRLDSVMGKSLDAEEMRGFVDPVSGR